MPRIILDCRTVNLPHDQMVSLRKAGHLNLGIDNNLAAQISAQGLINFSGYQLSGLFNFGSSAPATSTKVISTSAPVGTPASQSGVCLLILTNLFSSGISTASTFLPGGVSITQDQTCPSPSQGGVSTGVAASCTLFSLTSTYIRASATVPCTD